MDFGIAWAKRTSLLKQSLSPPPACCPQQEEEDLATQLQIHALPTLVFVPAKADKQALVRARARAPASPPFLVHRLRQPGLLSSLPSLTAPLPVQRTEGLLSAEVIEDIIKTKMQ